MKKSLKLKIDPRVYPLEAVQKTCYVFIDRAYLFLEGDPKKRIVVTMKGKKNLNEKELEKISGEFSNELLSNALRIDISRKNKKVREYIVGRALFSALEGGEEEALTNGDPLGIAVPWEEKYSKKA